MLHLVQRMLDLHQKLNPSPPPHAPNSSPSPLTPNEKTALQRQINTTDQQIDKLVYELYDLTDDEIAIVEGSFV